MFANSSPFFGRSVCCGTGHLLIVFQRFLYSQTFTLKKTPKNKKNRHLPLHLRVVSSARSAPDVTPAGDGKVGSRVCELILAQASNGVQGWTTLFGLKWTNGLWLKSKSGLGVTNTESQKWAGQTIEALFLLSLSLSKQATHTAKNNQTNAPFPKTFEISQLKAEWEPDTPNEPFFLTPSHLQRKFMNPFPEKLVQQQPASSFIATELKWGELPPEFFISLNINIIWEQPCTPTAWSLSLIGVEVKAFALSAYKDHASRKHEGELSDYFWVRIIQMRP